jgi:hypothetical protein
MRQKLALKPVNLRWKCFPELLHCKMFIRRNVVQLGNDPGLGCASKLHQFWYACAPTCPLQGAIERSQTDSTASRENSRTAETRSLPVHPRTCVSWRRNPREEHTRWMPQPQIHAKPTPFWPSRPTFPCWMTSCHPTFVRTFHVLAKSRSENFGLYQPGIPREPISYRCWTLRTPRLPHRAANPEAASCCVAHVKNDSNPGSSCKGFLTRELRPRPFPRLRAGGGKDRSHGDIAMSLTKQATRLTPPAKAPRPPPDAAPLRCAREKEPVLAMSQVWHNTPRDVVALLIARCMGRELLAWRAVSREWKRHVEERLAKQLFELLSNVVLKVGPSCLLLGFL